MPKRTTFTVSDDGRRAVIAWNVNGRSELELVSVPDGKRTPFAQAPGEVVAVSDFSPDGSRVALNVTGAARPQGAWQYEFASQRYTQIARSRCRVWICRHS
jgi:dipeptidyl aminopeptidase/acylaminoacyl peptidase